MAATLPPLLPPVSQMHDTCLPTCDQEELVFSLADRIRCHSVVGYVYSFLDQNQTHPW